MVDYPSPSLIPAELELELNTFIRTEITEVGGPWSTAMAWTTRYREVDQALVTACRQLDDLAAGMVVDEDMAEL